MAAPDAVNPEQVVLTLGGAAAGHYTNIEFITVVTASSDDNLTGGSGHEVFSAGGGNDVLAGRGGDDFLNGGAGADALDGGDGADAASYAGADTGLIVDLTDIAANTGEATGDTYTSIENLEGSAHSDQLFGDASANVLYGLGGADFIEGRDGADFIDGGAGADTLIGGVGEDTLLGRAGADILDGGVAFDIAAFGPSSVGVSVNLQTGIVSGGDAAGDTLISIEGLSGSNRADVLTGNNGVNNLYGQFGNDTLDGGGGDDTLVGGGGGDTLFGGAGADVLDGGAEFDIAAFGPSSVGVSINLLTGVASGGDAADDTLISIEGLSGSNLADVLVGDGAVNNLYGQLSADTLDGGGGNDTLDGGAGADALIGGGGGDTLFGGAGADVLDGGAEFDIAAFGSSAAGVSINLQTGTVSDGDAAGDTLISIEGLSGSNLADILVGNDGVNNLYGQLGDDTLDGGGGADNLLGGAGADVLDGGAGFDIAAFSSSSVGVNVNLQTRAVSGGDAAGDTLTGIEGLSGSNFADVLVGDGGVNNLYGQLGVDTLEGGGGNDTLDGGAGADNLFGGAGGDILFGGAGADVLDGGLGFDIAAFGPSSVGVSVNLQTGIVSGGDAVGDILISIEGLSGSNLNDVLVGDSGVNNFYGQLGNDTLDGGAGNDNLFGGAGGDILFGGAGGDILFGGAGADVLDGGAGFDIAAFGPSAVGVSVNLQTGIVSGGDAAGDTLISIEGLSGSNLNDVLVGDGGVNNFYGQLGNDTLDGGAGNDNLFGGAGADAFVFASPLATAGVDTISDFTVGVDGIRLDSTVFGLPTGTLDAAAFHTGAAATDAAHRLIYDNATGALYFDADGSNAGAAVQIANLSTGLLLTNNDFIVG